ncbi:MAG: type 1 glutamine amidotransferase domain-containing protein [Thermoanaerobacteraceae bacterium]|nr:type 1 glutamine amidotransferase domain-containing protein [Thermoanaerobacteraceae bacterium]
MSLNGKKYIMLVEEGFEDLELWYPVIRLREEGAEVKLLGREKAKTYIGKHGVPAVSDCTAADVSADGIDGLLVPGGWAPDKLRRDKGILELVRKVNEQGKLVAAICHAGWVLASAGMLKGRKMTCVSAIVDDMVNAGVSYLDQEVVVDGNLITSRTPEDLPAYMREIVKRESK